MSNEDTRKSAAHEQLNDIADKLAASAAAGSGEVQPSPYVPRQQPAPAHAATSADPAAAAELGSKPVESQTAPRSAPAAAPERPAATDQPSPLVIAKSEPPLRSVLITYFPMLIAIISLGMSIFQGYLFHRSIDLSQRSLDLVERNVARGEYIRTCREVIETYFQVKQKVSALMPAADRSNVVGASRITEAHRLDAQAAIAKFGGLGTYLANFQDPGTRARYTDLTRTLNGIMDGARTTQLADLDKLFEPADKLFASMNDDCVRLARTMRL
jgi:hypothetical protein